MRSGTHTFLLVRVDDSTRDQSVATAFHAAVQFAAEAQAELELKAALRARSSLWVSSGG